MKASFADLARRRLATLPHGPPSPGAEQAKADFIEAFINRDQRAARAACELMSTDSRPPPPLSAAERAKREPRYNAFLNFLSIMRQLRDEEKLGIVRPPPTPEQQAEGKVWLDQYVRWIRGDDSVGPFE